MCRSAIGTSCRSAAGSTVRSWPIHDPDDPVVPFTEAEAIAAALPDVQLQTAPGRGHMGILMASEVKSAVSAFVAQHSTKKRKVIV